ncbi:unnamed protein product [Clavelina lepadiformis]|uniref:Uncharacterized protein n=1 Tax=Clavelina lepadiformis TaxID=159417 RepID=A0ABP0GB53_CLALP
MPEVMIVACFIFLLFNTATGQPQSDMMRCSGPTNIHYHCGSNDFVDENRRSEERFSNSQQGRPGKSGVRGFKGEKGLKGEPGTNEDILRELQNLRSQVSALSQKIDRQSFARTCAEVSESRRESGIYVISPDSERVPVFSIL